MPKKLTHEEYVNRVKEINPDIEVLGIYINSQTKILHKCKIDGYEWNAKPNNILNGKGCPKCYGNIKKTHQEYVKEVALINPNIEVVGEYINNHTKILHKCKIDGHEWLSYPYNILDGGGCPKCYGHTKKTQEQYIKEVALINPNIEVVGIYINSQTKILHRCKIDGYEWMARPNDIVSGSGCPMCGNKIQKSHEQYLSEVTMVNPDIEVIGMYKGVFVPILHKCKIDGYEWYTRPNHILRGSGCPRCAKVEKYGHEEYVKRVNKINPNIEVLGEYINSFTSILHKCKIDGHEWYAIPSNILRSYGCPKCHESVNEKKISIWLYDNNIQYERQKTFADCKDKRLLLFDFYLPYYNILIEYNGIQHYEPIEYFGGKEKFESQVKRDNMKRKYCQKNHIFLFEIPYYSDLDEELLKLYELIKTKCREKEVVA